MQKMFKSQDCQEKCLDVQKMSEILRSKEDCELWKV